MIVCRREAFADVIDGIMPLLPHHYAETGTYTDIPLDPNYEGYRRAADAGVLRFYAARLDGELVGYAVMAAREDHPHYGAVKWATSNLFYVAPTARGAGVGSALLKAVEDDLAGFVVQIASSVDNPELAMLLTRRGYSPVEIIHSKRL